MAFLSRPRSKAFEDGDYMSRALSSPISRPPLHFVHSFVGPEEPILSSSRPLASAERGAQDLSRTVQ